MYCITIYSLIIICFMQCQISVHPSKGLESHIDAHLVWINLDYVVELNTDVRSRRTGSHQDVCELLFLG